MLQELFPRVAKLAGYCCNLKASSSSNSSSSSSSSSNRTGREGQSLANSDREPERHRLAFSVLNLEAPRNTGAAGSRGDPLSHTNSSASDGPPDLIEEDGPPDLIEELHPPGQEFHVHSSDSDSCGQLWTTSSCRQQRQFRR